MPGSCPPLRVAEVGDRIRLSLVGLTQADGDTLQDAAEALLCRLLVLAGAYRSTCAATDFSSRPEFGLLEFLRDLGEIASSGGSIRERVFGTS
jgi:hypothetical protein